MAEREPLTIIKLWNFFLLPLQGDITDELADRLRHEVLASIAEQGAEGLIIDVTGVWMIDSHLCSVISTIAASARLMGTTSIVCGMSSDIALTLQAMGVQLEAVRTALTVEEAFRLVGVGRTTTAVQPERKQGRARRKR